MPLADADYFKVKALFYLKNKCLTENLNRCSGRADKKKFRMSAVGIAAWIIYIAFFCVPLIFPAAALNLRLPAHAATDRERL